jgi:hypothetical protein
MCITQRKELVADGSFLCWSCEKIIGHKEAYSKVTFSTKYRKNENIELCKMCEIFYLNVPYRTVNPKSEICCLPVKAREFIESIAQELPEQWFQIVQAWCWGWSVPLCLTAHLNFTGPWDTTRLKIALSALMGKLVSVEYRHGTWHEVTTWHDDIDTDYVPCGSSVPPKSLKSVEDVLFDVACNRCNTGWRQTPLATLGSWCVYCDGGRLMVHRNFE